MMMDGNKYLSELGLCNSRREMIVNDLYALFARKIYGGNRPRTEALLGVHEACLSHKQITCEFYIKKHLVYE
jgi:hypothetical protein